MRGYSPLKGLFGKFSNFEFSSCLAKLFSFFVVTTLSSTLSSSFLKTYSWKSLQVNSYSYFKHSTFRAWKQRTFSKMSELDKSVLDAAKKLAAYQAVDDHIEVIN